MKAKGNSATAPSTTTSAIGLARSSSARAADAGCAAAGAPMSSIATATPLPRTPRAPLRRISGSSVAIRASAAAQALQNVAESGRRFLLQKLGSERVERSAWKLTQLGKARFARTHHVDHVGHAHEVDGSARVEREPPGERERSARTPDASAPSEIEDDDGKPRHG